MDLRRPLAILRRRALVLVALVAAGCIGAFLGSNRQNHYRAAAYLYVGSPVHSGTTPQDEYGQALLGSLLAPLVANPISISAALQEAGIRRSAESVAAATSATALSSANELVISVEDTDPLTAEQLTNAVAAHFARVAGTLPPLLAAAGVSEPTTSTTTSPGRGSRSETPATTVPAVTTTTNPALGANADTSGAPELVSLVKPALLPTTPLPTNLDRNVAIGAVGALAVGLGLVFLLDLVGLSARSARQLEDLLGLPVLGVVPASDALRDAEGRAEESAALFGSDR